MYIQDDYWEAVSGLGRDSQDRILGSLVRLYYLDEHEPEGLEAIEKAVFVALRERVLKGRSRSRSGRKGASKREANRQANAKQNGKQTASKPSSKREAKREANAKQNAKQTASKNEVCMPVCSSRVESESEIESESSTAATASVLQGGGGIEQSPEGFAQFLAHAVSEWNRATGQTYTALPGEARRGLLEAYRNDHAAEDIDRVIEVVMTWEPRFRTPNAAFADGKFEQWLNRPRDEPVQKPKAPQSAGCPQCGEERGPIAPGSPVFRCDGCGITWRVA